MSLSPLNYYQRVRLRYPQLAACLAVSLVIVLSAACSEDNGDGTVIAPTSPGSQGTGSADPPGDQATPAEAQDIDPETGLPRTFPEEFPVYEGATVFRASQHQDRYVVEWRIPGEIAPVVDFYETQLAESPWELEETEETDGVTMVNFAGETDREFTGSLAIAELSGQARIFLNLNFNE